MMETWIPTARLEGLYSLMKALSLVLSARFMIAPRFSKALQKSVRVHSQSASVESTPRSTHMNMLTKPALESKQFIQFTGTAVMKDNFQGQLPICRFSKYTSHTTVASTWVLLTCSSSCACPLTPGQFMSITTTRLTSFLHNLLNLLPSQRHILRLLKNTEQR